MWQSPVRMGLTSERVGVQLGVATVPLTAKRLSSDRDRQGLPQSGHIKATKDSNQSDFLGQGWMGKGNA